MLPLVALTLSLSLSSHVTLEFSQPRKELTRRARSPNLPRLLRELAKFRPVNHDVRSLFDAHRGRTV